MIDCKDQDRFNDLRLDVIGHPAGEQERQCLTEGMLFHEALDWNTPNVDCPFVDVSYGGRPHSSPPHNMKKNATIFRGASLRWRSR